MGGETQGRMIRRKIKNLKKSHGNQYQQVVCLCFICPVIFLPDSFLIIPYVIYLLFYYYYFLILPSSSRLILNIIKLQYRQRSM